jgi:hypothetical protein
MTKPPCKVNGVDCPMCYVGCQSECEKYREWLAIHEAEKEAQRKDKYNPADDFLIKQQERVKLARHRDYMREYKRK